MAEKRIEITQGLCRQVQLLIKGGASNKEAGEITGTSAATVSRIRSANYDAFKYQQNTEARRGYKLPVHHGGTFHKWVHTDEGMKCIEVRAEDLVKNDLQEEKKEDQVPGQLRMFIPGENQPPVPLIDENKLMRFLAGKMEQQAAKQDELMRELGRELGGMLIDIIKKLDKINDNLCQIMRRMDK